MELAASFKVKAVAYLPTFTPSHLLTFLFSHLPTFLLSQSTLLVTTSNSSQFK
jgi:hypothetical protein